MKKKWLLAGSVNIPAFSNVKDKYGYIPVPVVSEALLVALISLTTQKKNTGKLLCLLIGFVTFQHSKQLNYLDIL